MKALRLPNGWVSKSCQMQRRFEQGCPVFALLFILVLEILAIQLGNNDEITRFIAR